MTMHAVYNRSRGRDEKAATTDVSSERLLELLGDEYTRKVLYAVAERPRTGTEVLEAASVSKATAYRRLNDLEEAGLVESELVVDPEGHHHERFYAVFRRAHLSFADDGTALSLDLASPGRTERTRVRD